MISAMDSPSTNLAQIGLRNECGIEKSGRRAGQRYAELITFQLREPAGQAEQLGDSRLAREQSPGDRHRISIGNSARIRIVLRGDCEARVTQGCSYVFR
mgnify:CR=1 FL=1